MDMAIDDYSTGKHILLLRKWLEQCDRHHDDRCKAVSIADRPSWQVPDWVIDTNQGCIVPGSSIKQYAALSYVWESPSPEGSRVTSERLMLCHDNIEEFQRPGFLSADVKKSLPAAVQDSIVLVLQSGVRYLWVDCLCIVQHTETTGDRVKAMSEIYYGAYFTIVAATTGGGLFDRKPGDNVAAKARRALLWRRGALWFTANAQRLYSSLLASHWATRGWTFQEQLLSKRSINFIDEIVFWDCECSVWWPSLAELENGSGDTSNPKPGPEFDCNSMKYDTFGIANEKYIEAQKHKELSQSLKSTSVPNFRLYMELICRYNHRNLTYPQDALPAFSGVLRCVAEASSSRFICGLPVLFLDAALLWQPLWKAKRRLATDRGRNIAPSAPLPSWSWVGWQCLIDPESMVSGLDYEVGDVMDGISDPPHRSWKTSKLVDWYILPNKDVQTGELLKEHQWMESCKLFQSSPYAEDLPKGWSRKLGSEFVSWEEAGDAAILQLWKTHVGETPMSEDSPGPASKPVEWYFHGVQDDILYYYPIPTSNASSPTAASLSDAPFLSCVTTVAHFKVRRMLVC
ncbi:hypothetical protein PFICI_07040 [Pestalotiopsis fici W106-1]|uniref:Heterokaryon incompatibility domain-containing protein n=1 Tax=Pestalotiopsis fici (strain W106-1 / CGMCC3.15140) TaxID=1229662 RepID=W3X7E4_PESFW|nr:uncharacterized protein PFICI_07040 [Pestalotiopsis fici W106-1]ETS82038.1 hypothetical protein PFICI_07040 [Pestalotiopsis fici W106-1]